VANRRLHLPLLATALVAAPLCAAGGLKPLAPASLAQIHSQESLRATQAQDRLMGLRGQFGMDADGAFAPARVYTDAFGETHARFNQLYRGVKVWNGEIIAHIGADGEPLAPTAALKGDIFLNTTPSLTQEEALATATRDLAPKGPFAYQPTAELVIYPIQTAFVHQGPRHPGDADAPDGTEQAVLRYALAYHIHTQLENGTAETAHTDYMIDAHTGAILKKWSTLRTADATGTANTQYSGTRQIHTDSTGSTYQMVDNFRAMHISTYNLNHGTGSGTGTLYTDADNTWGDGANYVEGSSTTAANGETAATDAHFGIEVTYDFYKNIMGRNGIDNANRATYSRVHYSNSYDNAFWDDTCFCMTYGDGSSFTTLTALDVAGHEMSHGVCANSAGLNYSGESGGLNESNSDILGNMVELYSKSSGTLPSSVANTDGCWMVGEQLSNPPLRYMYKPSLDGGSKDAWSSSLGGLDVHYSSGPNNRMFFFLSQGATTSGNYSTTYLPNGMTGVGPNHAAQIWYRALTVYLTASSNYAAARTACMSAAADLYGTGSAEYAAVQNAYHGINVGAAAPSGGDTTAPTASASESGTSGTITLSATASDNVGVTKVEFYVDGALKGSDTTSPYSMTLNSTTLANGSHSLVAKAYDAANNVGSSAAVSFSVSNSTGGTELIKNGGFESGATSWTQTSGVIGAYGASEPTHGGTYDAWLNGYGSTHSDHVYQTITVPAGASPTLSFYLHIDTAETTTTTAYDKFYVRIYTSGGTLLKTLATFSNLNKTSGYTLRSYNLGAYAGQSIRVAFYGTEDSSLQTSFVLDDVSVK
jgi:Zn-dependent metalloprotease